MDVLQETTAGTKPVRNTSHSSARPSSRPSSHAASSNSKPSATDDFPSASQYQSTMEQMLMEMQKNQQKAEQMSGTVTSSAQDLCDSTQKELEEMRRNIEKDFGITGKPADGTKKPQTANQEQIPDKQPEPVTIETFAGAEDVVAQEVFGQTTLLKKLMVAFKRPFILPEEKDHAKNCFYIYGPADSGKHFALKKVVAELNQRGILSSGTVYDMDLSRYPEAGKDNVFLQDLYMALQSESNVILFENFEKCHISYLTYVSDLVTKGECYLQDRYMLQQGQLINVANAFTKQTVSTFTASGKYLAFLGIKDEESLANVFGAPFINALGDIVKSEKLTEESYGKLAKVQWDGLVTKAKNQLSFVLSAEEEPLIQAAIAATGKNAGTNGLMFFFDKILKALATMKLEGSYAKDTKVKLTIEDTSLMAQIGEEKTDLMDNLPAAYTGNIASVKAELDGIVGLTEVKKYILSLEEYYNTQKRRTEAGLKASDVSKHMIFTGNPGTGKTTIARIISRYLKAIGILTGGQLVEVSRADLVGRFVGHTAPLVNQVIKSALGGVLFIDEAYSLYRGKDDAFGLEAIDTLVKGIEDNRDNLIVILAGYSNEMAEFLEANSGLKSRFPNIIDFPDYTGEELLEITKITVRSKGYVLDSEAEAPLLDFYKKVQALIPDTAGNGRLVRNKVEEAILNQSRRLVAEPEADMSLLLTRDFVMDDNFF